MNFTIAEALKFFAALRRELPQPPTCELVICPPFTSLYALDEAFQGTPYKLGAQNMHWEDSGAYTGEIAPNFLTELNASYVLLGHSERRKHFQETDILINKKVSSAFTHGMTPIVCVGETEGERNENRTMAVVSSQVRAALEGQLKSELNYLVWAYEPVWAIGTGKNATAKEAQEVSHEMRKLLAQALDTPTAESMRILYGGSVSEENARNFLTQPDIDGLLVGGASLDAKRLAQIVKTTD